MRKLLIAVYIVMCCLQTIAQAPSDFVIPVKVTVASGEPASITLSWPANADATSYSIKRKLVSDDSYKSNFEIVATITSAAATNTGYRDETIQKGFLYEYEISGTFSPSLPATRSNYICAGIEIPPVHSRGSILLLCDSNIVNDISVRLQRLYADLTGDGWRVIRMDVTGSANPVDAARIKSKIERIYNQVSDLKQLLIIGHVPVPYAGINLGPDGHTNHIGAWPADGYYGSFTGNWTDNRSSTFVASTRNENRNLPGDGKFDQDSLPPVQLGIGRIDLSNLPVFSMFEADLLNRYLDKDHSFRHGQTVVQKRALIEDNFTSFTEKFSQSAWKSFSSTVGYDNVLNGQYESWLQWPFGFLWSYGAGAGTYTGAGGIGNSGDFVTQSYNTVFSQLFGSYFGDWDSPDNYMRSSIASAGNTLACVWGGRPHWYFHNMSAGMPIGYAALLTMNNRGIYQNPGYGNAYAHIALMGDPTLRSSYTKPPQAFFAQASQSIVNLLWTRADEDSITGYYIYRSNSIAGKFVRLTENPVTTLQFRDSTPLSGRNVYMVRTVKMDTIITTGSYTNNSTYYNLSQGLFDSVTVQGAPGPVISLEPLFLSEAPVQVVVMKDSIKKYFVAQKNGEVKLYDQHFNLVNTYIHMPGINEGFFSLAFDPGYETNRVSYAFYTNANGDLELSRFKEEENATVALHDGIMLTIPDPGPSKNLGGDIHFDANGYLFLSTGDGDTKDAAANNAQNVQSLLGKILRIKPAETMAPASSYTIPSDNPYGNEVYASGLRFPYRWMLNKLTKEIWIGDRGDSSFEEIERIPLTTLKGANFGWPCYEADLALSPGVCSSPSGFTFPVYHYPSPGTGSSVTGGVFYRGETYIDLKDQYVFADANNGRIYLTRYDSLLETYITSSQLLAPGAFSDISEDSDGELYATSLMGGVYRIGASGRRRYIFLGEGNWDDANNWSNKTIPPAVLPTGSEIIIRPANDGECILNVPQTISAGSKLIVENNKHFRISGNLEIE